MGVLLHQHIVGNKKAIKDIRTTMSVLLDCILYEVDGMEKQINDWKKYGRKKPYFDMDWPIKHIADTLVFLSIEQEPTKPMIIAGGEVTIPPMYRRNGKCYDIRTLSYRFVGYVRANRLKLAGRYADKIRDAIDDVRYSEGLVSSIKADIIRP